MYIYIIELLLVWLFGLFFLKKYNSRIVFLICTFLMLALVLGARGNSVGEDTKHYIHVYECASDVSWKEIFSGGVKTVYFVDETGYADKMEDGFLILCKLVRLFTDNAQVFLLVVALLSCMLIAKFIYDNCEDVFFATYVFMCESIYMNMFNGIRQLLAMAVGICAYNYIKKKKVFSAVIVILLAFYIHNSAIVFFLLLVLGCIPKRKEKTLFGFIFILGSLIPVMLPLIQKIVAVALPRYAAYFLNNYWEANIGGTMVLWMIELICIFIMYCGKFKHRDSFKVAVIVLMYLLLEMIGLKYTAMARLAWHYRIFLIVFLPMITKYLCGKDVFLYKLGIYLIVTMAFMSYANTGARVYSFWLCN